MSYFGVPGTYWKHKIASWGYWNLLEPLGRILGLLELIGTIRSHLGVAETYWNHKVASWGC